MQNLPEKSKIETNIWIHLMPMVLFAAVFIILAWPLTEVFFSESATRYFIDPTEKLIYTYLPIAGMLIYIGAGIYLLLNILIQFKKGTILIETTIKVPEPGLDFFYVGYFPDKYPLLSRPLFFPKSTWVITSSEEHRRLQIDWNSRRLLTPGDKVKLEIYPKLRIIKSIEFIK